MSSTPFYEKTYPSAAPLSRCFEDHVQTQTQKAFRRFKTITRRYAQFHIGFFLLSCMELVGFALFFTFLTQSTIFAFSLAGIFLTGFSYFVILFYLQAKKPEQLIEVRNQFFRYFQENLSSSPSSLEYHSAIVYALSSFCQYLDRKEYTYYSLPSFFQTLGSLMQKFSVWCHWKDRHQMQELLLTSIIKEHVEMIRIAPTDFDTHASLAATYMQQARLYKSDLPYAFPDMHQQFEKAAKKALEEYKILDEYAPDDPWIQAQLASIFHDLEMPAEETRSYEHILQIAPEDPHILFRLGCLYFAQGRNADGLRIYEQLKRHDFQEADELLAHY